MGLGYDLCYGPSTQYPVPSWQLIKYKSPNDIEALLIEINLGKTKFPLLMGYPPPPPPPLQIFFWFHH